MTRQDREWVASRIEGFRGSLIEEHRGRVDARGDETSRALREGFLSGLARAAATVRELPAEDEIDPPRE